MADIIFPNSTAPGIRPGEGAGRLINCYAEPLASGSRKQFSHRRVPGLSLVATTAHIGCRGMHFYNGDLYVAQTDRLSRINLVGALYVVTDLGALPGTGRVTFARNNKAPINDLICVTENDTYVVHQATPPTSLGDGDLPAALTVDFLDGYFIWAIRDGRFFVSGINATTVSALDFGKAESHPDGIYRAIAFGELLYLCGPKAIEAWQNAGNATGSPFSRAAVIPVGLASTFAIAGNEYGFSALIFVGNDNGVHRLDGGYQPTKISSPDLDRLIEAVEDKTLLDVTVFTVSGHMWAVVSGPDFSWAYELATGLWHERASYLINHWRAVCSTEAFGKWVVGDRLTGSIWFVDPNEMTEGGDPLIQTVISLPTSDFPNRTAVSRADFDCIVGQGQAAGQQPIETDPVCLISWSDDGGNTFSTPLKRSLGRMAEHNTPVTVNRTGTTGRYGRVWKIDVSDPVYVSWLGGTMDAQPRAH
jgi:hypothetical protein